MSAPSSRAQPDTIDLTADDDSPGDDGDETPFVLYPAFEDQTLSDTESILRRSRRAPPFHSDISMAREIIELESDPTGNTGSHPNENGPEVARPQVIRADSSPDVVITGSRQLPLNPGRRLPTPPALRGRLGRQGGIAEYLRRGHEAIFGAALGEAGQRPNLDLRQMPAFLIRHNFTPALTLEADFLTEHYDDVAFNYNQTAFDFERRDVGGPHGRAARSSTPPEIIDPEPYKEPPPPEEGFVRNLAEHDMAVCPCCGDELALGDGDVKQQIWVAKQCGHVRELKEHA